MLQCTVPSNHHACCFSVQGLGDDEQAKMQLLRKLTELEELLALKAAEGCKGGCDFSGAAGAKFPATWTRSNTPALLQLIPDAHCAGADPAACVLPTPPAHLEAKHPACETPTGAPFDVKPPALETSTGGAPFDVKPPALETPTAGAPCDVKPPACETPTAGAFCDVKPPVCETTERDAHSSVPQLPASVKPQPPLLPPVSLELSHFSFQLHKLQLCSDVSFVS